ncbi:MAG: hypothetical protein AAGJ92_11160, partial [Pseudomonadota bacterium]
ETGRASYSALAGGAEATSVQNTAGGIVETNAYGLQTTYQTTRIEGQERVTQIDGAAAENCLATTQNLGYTPVGLNAPDGYIYERINRNGAVTRYERDVRGLVTRMTEDATGADQRVTTYDWDPTFRLMRERASVELKENWTYVPGSALVATYAQEDVLSGSPDFGETRTWTNGYTTLGSGLTVLTSSNGPGLVSEGVTDVTTYTYDPTDGLLLTMTDPVGLTMEVVSRSPLGQPERVRMPDGVEFEFAYDFRGRLITSTFDAAGTDPYSSFYHYDTIGQLLSITDAKGDIWTFAYDDVGRLIAEFSPDGDRINYRYDEAGNISGEYHTALARRTFSQETEFDALGRIFRTLGAEGQTTEINYDVEDNPTRLVDGLGNATINGFDALNRLI